MTMTRTRIVLLVVLLVLAGGGFWLWRHLASSETTDDAQVDGHVYAVNARIGGALVAVNVLENQMVQAGEVLVKIDDRDFKNAMSKAQADLRVAQAGYEQERTGMPLTSSETKGRIERSEAALAQVRTGVDTAQRDYEVAQARYNLATTRLSEVQTTFDIAGKDLERVKPLIKKDEISQQQYDAVASAYDAAKAAVDSSRANIAEAKSNMSSAQARVAQAHSAIAVAESDVTAARSAPDEIAQTQAKINTASARVAQAGAAIDQVKTNLDYTVVRAPVAGIVTRKNAEVGQVVQAGQPLLAIVPLEEVWVTANFKETQLKDIRLGQAAEVHVDAYGGATFKAHVDSISAATGAKFSLLPAENASGNYVKVVQRVPVKLLFDGNADPAHVLRPGMSVVVKVFTGTESH